MAKTSQVLRDKRRKKLIKKYAAKRAVLRKTLQDPEASIDDKLEAQVKFAKLPRNSCPTRLNRRCELSGRSIACPTPLEPGGIPWPRPRRCFATSAARS